MIRKYIHIILLVICATMMSCAKADDNGELGGNWQLREIAVVESESVKDVQGDDLFLSVQLRLMNLRGIGFARFVHQGDSLHISMIDHVESSTMLRYGMDSTRQSFRVERLTRTNMVLRSNYAVLKFHKF